MRAKKSSNKKEEEEKDMKLVSRADVLSGCQNFSIIAGFLLALIIVLVMTGFAADMFIYDEGNVYSCPADYLNGELDKLKDED